MPWHSPQDAMPWVGLYVGVASLVCTFAMAADVFQGFRQWKLWFPCRFFTLNAASITLIAIAMKLPVDLTSDMSSLNDKNAKLASILFLFTMLANFLPSLGLMNDKELLTNIIALGILIVTITVNVFIQSGTKVFLGSTIELPVVIFPLLWPFSLALTVPTSRRLLEHRYNELHKPTTRHQEREFSYKELIHHVKKYWMMTETGSPQFVLACSPFCSASGVICSIFVVTAFGNLVIQFDNSSIFSYAKSDYKWSINIIIVVQSIGIVVGSIAPMFRSFTAFGFFSLSKKWSMNHINMFKVEKHWTQRLQQWKRSHVRSHIPGRHCKKVFHIVKNMFLNLCLALHITVVVICKTLRLIPSSFAIVFSCSLYSCKSMLKKFKREPNASNNDARSDVKEYTSHVMQLEKEAKLSNRILRNMLRSITKLLRTSELKEPRNLIKLLEKSTGFNGVVDFDSDEVPPIHSEETHNCWSLVAVTLTAIAIALPNITNSHMKVLLSSMKEGLEFVRHIEESLNANGDLVKARKAARRVWTNVEVYYRWMQIDLQKKACKGKTSKEILQWLGDEAVKIVIQFKQGKNGSLGQSPHKFIAANSMYRISQTILLHCNGLDNWPKDEELLEWISTIIADLLSACFTNLPRVITMKCHDDSLEKREESIRTAAQLLGQSKKILNILQTRQLPTLELDSIAYIDEWHTLLKSQNSKSSASLTRSQPPSSSSNECIVVIIEK